MHLQLFSILDIRATAPLLDQLKLCPFLWSQPPDKYGSPENKVHTHADCHAE